MKKLKANEKKKIAKQLETGSQGSAILSALSSGMRPSVSDLTELGIADPRRVVNTLRAKGHSIESEKIKGETFFYSA